MRTRALWLQLAGCYCRGLHMLCKHRPRGAYAARLRATLRCTSQILMVTWLRTFQLCLGCWATCNVRLPAHNSVSALLVVAQTQHLEAAYCRTNFPCHSFFPLSMCFVHSCVPACAAHALCTLSPPMLCVGCQHNCNCHYHMPNVA